MIKKTLLIILATMMILAATVTAASNIVVLYEGAEGEKSHGRAGIVMTDPTESTYTSWINNELLVLRYYAYDGGNNCDAKILVTGSDEYMDNLDSQIRIWTYGTQNFASLWNEQSLAVCGKDAEFLGRIRGQENHDAFHNGAVTTSLVIESVDGGVTVDFSGTSVNMSEVLDMTTNSTVNFTTDMFTVTDTEISVKDSTMSVSPANLTITAYVAPVIVTVNGDAEACVAPKCTDYAWNSTLENGTLTLTVANFSDYQLQGGSNIFTIHEPPSSCSSGYPYLDCLSPRYGLLISETDTQTLGVYNFMRNTMHAAASQLYSDYGCDFRLLFSGSNSWYTAWEGVTYGINGDTNWFEAVEETIEQFSGCEDIKVLGRIKGQSNNDALLSGGQANSFVIDSDFATVTYNSTSDINMSQVLDMASNSLVTNDPFETSASLISVDSSNYPTLDKKATIKFKNINANNPQLIKDGDYCVAPDCTNVVHDTVALTLSAEVTGFSTYLIYDMNPDTPTTINAPTTQRFTVTATNQTIVYQWFADSVEQIGETNNYFDYGVTLSDEGSHNISVSFIDAGNLVHYDWTVTVTAGYEATYESGDIDDIVIDGFGKLLLVFTVLAGLIGFGILFVWVIKKTK